MKKYRLWSGKTPKERGKEAEERFFSAWKDPKFFSPWMVSIERPTLHEDTIRKTDAVIVCHPGPNLKIQIKSYWLTLDECRLLMRHDVVPLSVCSNDSLKRIRKKTKMAVQKFRRYLNSSEYISKSFYIKKHEKGWYRHGKKVYR